MKTIRDAIHGNIKLNDLLAEKILDHPLMQRLRRIKQIPFINLVYPSANHTRFEHSLGVYELTRRILQNNGLDSPELETYALIHDIGHYPLAHTLENFFEKNTGRDHEEHMKILIKNTDLKDRINECGMDYRKVVNIGSRKVGEVVWGDLGTDRIDYLLRDSYHTGKSLVFDYHRLIDEIKIKRDGVFVSEKGREPAEALLLFRFWMWENVYSHHTRKIVAKMLEESVKNAEEKGMDLKEYTLADDYEIIRALIIHENYWITRILNRNLFKRAYESKNTDLIEKDSEALREEIEKRAKTTVLVDIPKNLRFKEVKAEILMDGKKHKLHEISSVVKIIDKLWEENWKAYVYCDKKDISKVKKVAKEILEK